MQQKSLGFDVSMMLVLAGALSACGGGHDASSSTDPGGTTPSSTPASTPTPTAQASTTSRLPGIEVSFTAVPAAAGALDSGGAYDIRVDDPAAVESVSLVAADSSVLATVAGATRAPYRLRSGTASRPAFVSLLLKDGNVVETPVVAP